MAQMTGIDPGLAQRQGNVGFTDAVKYSPLAQVQNGAELLKNGPRPLDDSSRKLQDVFWAVFFLIVAVGVMVFSLMSFGTVFRAPVGSPDTKAFDKEVQTKGVFAVSIAALVGLGSAVAYLQLAKRCTTCVVYVALLLSPVMLIIAGLASVFAGVLLGGLLSVVGLLLAMCILCCWRSLIPFTVTLIQGVIQCIEAHPGVITVSILGAMLTLVWCFFCFMALVGIIFAMQGSDTTGGDSTKGGGTGPSAVSYFFFLLVFYWGAMVFQNACQLACNGVFGRWYFGKDPQQAVSLSLKVAFTTSFGSVCFGSFVVAAVRALQATIRMLRAQAQDEGNAVLCVILAILECFVRCIGDCIDWFNNFAYVQCAIRGFGFLDAARATYALCTFANVDKICADSLVGSVTALGALFCALLGGLTAVLIASTALQRTSLMAFSGILGVVVAMAVSSAALQPLSSGATTLLVCWAEHPEALERSQPGLYAEFNRRANNMDLQNVELLPSNQRTHG